MAQLRDSHTSETIAEGTPLELVTIVDELGLKAGIVGIDETADELGLELIYDGVGLGFNPDAVRQARDENLDGLKAASNAKATPDRGARDAVARAHKAALAELEDAKAAAAAAGAELERIRADAPGAAPA